MNFFNHLKLLFAGDGLTDLIFLANKEREAYNYSLAIKYQLRIKSILSSYPDNKETIGVKVSNFYLLVNDYLNIKQVDKAEKEILEAYSLYKNNKEILLAYILVLLNKRDYNKALTIIEELFEISPDNGEGLYYRGVCYGYLGSHQKSLEDFLKIDKNEPEFSETQYNIGNAYEGLKNYEKAIIYFTKAIELDSLYAYPYISRGNCYMQVNQKEKACQDFYKALDLGEERVQENIDEHCK